MNLGFTQKATQCLHLNDEPNIDHPLKRSQSAAPLYCPSVIPSRLTGGTLSPCGHNWDTMTDENNEIDGNQRIS